MPKTFLPDNYEGIPKSMGNYMKFTEPENKFRILDNALVGWELWVGGKPIRNEEKQDFTPEELDNADINKFTGKKRIPAYFWAFPVLNYQTGNIEILEVNQKTVLEGMERYLLDEDFGGDPTQYDFVVDRDDTGEIVKYTVRAKPPKKLDEGVAVAFKDMEINVKALLDGGDPFEGKTGKEAKEVFEK